MIYKLLESCVAQGGSALWGNLQGHAVFSYLKFPGNTFESLRSSTYVLEFFFIGAHLYSTDRFWFHKPRWHCPVRKPTRTRSLFVLSSTMIFALCLLKLLYEILFANYLTIIGIQTMLLYSNYTTNNKTNMNFICYNI